MRAGLLRSRIVIEERTDTVDAVGFPAPAWAEFATVDAQIRQLSARELFSAQQVHAEQVRKISIRYIEGVTTNMRITWGEKTFDILSVVNVDERNREIEIMALERSA